MQVEALRDKCQKLVEQYQVNIAATKELQELFSRDILPSLIDELNLCSEAIQWAEAWLQDTVSIFHVMRRHDFTKSSAMESIRKTLMWRRDQLWDKQPSSRVSMIHCLPSDKRDPFGRPIIVVHTHRAEIDSCDHQVLVIHAMESLRLHLKGINDGEKHSVPALQFVMLLDLADLAISDINLDLINWFLRQVIPHFPGLLAGVFVVNYSWTHSGLWNIAKRILPASALSRVFFPSEEELLEYFTVSCLPKDYGGSLQLSKSMVDPLQIIVHHHYSTIASPSPTNPEMTSAGKRKPPAFVLNPFYGYPVEYGGQTPTLYYGRRRKRDLLRTLLVLFWRRWRWYIASLLGVVIVLQIVKLACRSPGASKALRILISRMSNRVFMT